MTFSSMRPWLGGAVIAVSIASSAAAQDAKAVFEARYAEISAAMQARDSAAAAKIMTPDFVMTDIQGDEHTAAEMGGGMMGRRPGGRGNGGPPPPAAAGPGAPDAPPAVAPPRPVPKITIVSAQINGTTAQVEQQTEIHMDRPGPDGAPMKLDVTVLTADTWVQTSGVWLLQASNQKDVSVSRDGEVVFHQAK